MCIDEPECLEDNVAYLADHAAQSKYWTPEQMLERVLCELRSKGNKFKPNKAILILIEDPGEGKSKDYSTRYANLYHADAIVWLENVKFELLYAWAKGNGIIDDGKD